MRALQTRLRRRLTAIGATILSASAALGANYVVTNTNDSGSGSLREAITLANANAGADTITFSLSYPATITLSSSLPNVTGDLTITGPGASSLAISGNNAHRVLFVNGAALGISNLTIKEGRAQGGNGGDGGYYGGGGGGGAGLGGAIVLNGGYLVASGVEFANNAAIGGTGGGFINGNGNQGGGGGGGVSGNGASNVSNGVGASGGSGGPFGGVGGAAGVAGDEGGGGGGGNTGVGGLGGFGGGGGGTGSNAAGGGGGGFGGGGGGGASSIHANAVGGTFAGSGDEGSGAGGGGAGLGGALFLRAGAAELLNCSFLNNTATRGNSGTTGFGTAQNGQGKSGAIFVHTGAGLVVSNPTYSGNTATDAGSSATDNANIYGSLSSVPAVSGIVRSSTSPTNATSVSFTVSFGESVTGVSTGDFSVTATGTAAAAVHSVSGSGSSYTVTVNGVSGDGTLRLDLVDDDSIQSASGLRLGGLGAANGDYTAGATYTVDHTAPAVQAVSLATALAIDVQFSEPIGSGATTAANYALSGSGRGSLSTNPASVALQSGNTYRLTWSSGEMVQGGNLTVTVTGVADAVGNAIGGSNSATAGSAGQGAAPSVASAEVVLANVVDVTFTEAMDGTDIITPANFTISGSGVGNLPPNPTWISAQSASVTRLVWAADEMFDGGTVEITVASSVRDAAGNSIGSAVAVSDVGGAIGTKPTATIASVFSTVNAGDEILFDVTFSEAVSGFDNSGDLTIATDGVTVSSSAISATSESVYRVTLGGVSGGGTVSLALAAGVASDAAGNLSEAAESTSVAVVELQGEDEGDDTPIDTPAETDSIPTVDDTSSPPVLSVVTRISDARVRVGENVTVELVIGNSGSGEATDVVITIALPDTVEFVEARFADDAPSGRAPSINSTVSGNTLTLSIGDVEPGEQVEIELDLKAVVSGAIEIAASAISAELTEAESAEIIEGLTILNAVTSGGSVCGFGASPALMLAGLVCFKLAGRRR